MTDEMEPCPFCGAEAVYQSPNSPRTELIVRCLDCGATVPDLAAWNRRAFYNEPATGISLVHRLVDEARNDERERCKKFLELMAKEQAETGGESCELIAAWVRQYAMMMDDANFRDTALAGSPLDAEEACEEVGDG